MYAEPSARAPIEAGRPRFPASRDEASRLAIAFQTVMKSGDMAALGRLLAEDAVLHSDGGGKKSAALNPIRGADKIVSFVEGVARKNPELLASDTRPASSTGCPTS